MAFEGGQRAAGFRELLVPRECGDVDSVLAVRHERPAVLVPQDPQLLPGRVQVAVVVQDPALEGASRHDHAGCPYTLGGESLCDVEQGGLPGHDLASL